MGGGDVYPPGLPRLPAGPGGFVDPGAVAPGHPLHPPRCALALPLLRRIFPPVPALVVISLPRTRRETQLFALPLLTNPASAHPPHTPPQQKGGGMVVGPHHPGFGLPPPLGPLPPGLPPGARFDPYGASSFVIFSLKRNR